jgi:hypothetical protein
LPATRAHVRSIGSPDHPLPATGTASARHAAARKGMIEAHVLIGDSAGGLLVRRVAADS